MLRHIFLIVGGFLCWVSVAVGQPTIENTDVDTMEWKVSYEAPEDFTQNFHYKKRPVLAIRLKIRKNSDNTYSGKLWVFTGAWNTTTMRTDYSLSGKTDNWFALNVQGDSLRRDRIGFQAKQVDLNIGNHQTKKINVNGIWQYGRDKTRPSHRIVLKINHAPHQISSTKPAQAPSPLPAPYDNCEDDPDSDVLEEAGSPMGSDPDAPPTDP